MKELICITCPAGCKLLAELTPEGGVNVTGHTCKRGVDFALAELTRPTRTLCSTVRARGGPAPMLPVRTDREIPKGKIAEVMRLLTGIVVERSMRCGEVVTGLMPICEENMIATSDFHPNESADSLGTPGLLEG